MLMCYTHEVRITDNRICASRAPSSYVQSAIEKVYRSVFLAMMIVAVIAFVIALIFSYRLAAPILAMERFTKDCVRGIRLGIFLETSDETEKLADNINYLVMNCKSDSAGQ